MNATPHILLVEDEASLAEGIRLNLEMDGLAVTVRTDGQSGLATARGGAFDLIILDVMLPGLDGFTLCRELRAHGSQTPILFLTARSGDAERIEGFEAGADDFLGKPFVLRELLLRVRAILRRRPGAGAAAVSEPSAGNLLDTGAFRIDFTAFTGHGPRGPFQLSGRECKILRLLTGRAGMVVSRDDILHHVWGADAYPSERTVDNFIVRLRRYLEPDPANPTIIQSVRGVGYRYVPPDGPGHAPSVQALAPGGRP